VNATLSGGKELATTSLETTLKKGPGSVKDKKNENLKPLGSELLKR